MAQQKSTDQQAKAQRSTEAVFRDHLAKRKAGQVEDDIQENYAEAVVLLTMTGIFRGHEGVRKAAQTLEHYQPDATFEYLTEQVADAYALLKWQSTSPKGEVWDGVDSFVIREGKIIAQTIHYTVDRSQTEA